jgi:peptidase M28-like protein
VPRLLIVLAVVLACGPAAAGQKPAVTVAPGSQVSGARAKAFATQIAALGPRPAGSAVERQAGSLVAARLRALGYRVTFQPIGLPRGGSSRNIVALPQGPVRVLLLAHVDGVSKGPAANDNGSGVAVLLELAQALRGASGVMLVATGAEERVETRSIHHLGALRLLRGLSREARGRIRLALSIDMIGWGPRLHVRGLEPWPNRSAEVALRYVHDATYLADPGWSDHAELTRAGLPAAWLERRDDPCWHSACDTARRLDAAKLERTGKAVLDAVRAALEG